MILNGNVSDVLMCARVDRHVAPHNQTTNNNNSVFGKLSDVSMSMSIFKVDNRY